ncbi:MAG: ferric reductase-like transmembrane domain-containing protein [Acidobacteriota bacterium]|nr:ferric reductase-like transmembrane domain-containing protein [Acidobacteriota bacterium]
MTTFDWYLIRGTGVVTLILFTLVVALGIATTKRLRIARLPRFVTLALHRNVSLLAAAFLGVHIVTSMLDSYAHVGLAQVFVPAGTTRYAAYLGLGALSFDMIVALVVTSLVRHRLTQRVWKGVHWLGYASWPVALTHAVGVGTDSASRWLSTVCIACAGLVGATIAWRLLELRRPYPKYLGAAS